MTPATQKRRHESLRRRKLGLAGRSLAEFSTEKQIQATICEILDVLRLPYSITDASRVFGVDGRVRPSKVATGWPDITGCLMTGRFFCIEVKSAHGRLSDAQKRTLARLDTAGAAVCIAHSVDEVVDFLISKGDLIWTQKQFLERWRTG